MVKEERTDYAQRIILAKRRPDLYLNLTIDGSDNSAYGFPYFSDRTHSTSRGHKVKSKLYAAILHGHFGAAFTFATNLTGGSVVTVEIINKMLDWFLQDKPGNRLPPTLWIQLDNTCRDNKNRYVFGFLHSLVDMGLFQEVEVNFLPVGHTHCDIDQLFSRVSVYLYGNNCFSFRDLLRKAQAACKLIKYTDRLYGFANWTKHCHAHGLIDEGEEFNHFTHNRQFRFVRTEKRAGNGSLVDFSTMMQCRRDVFATEWVDLHGQIGVSIPLAKKKLNFNNVFGLGDLSTLDYLAQRIPGDPQGKRYPVREMYNNVLASQTRLTELLGAEQGMQIVNGLLREVQRQTIDIVVPFKWDLTKYREPVTNWDSNAPFRATPSAATLAFSEVRQEAVRIRLFEDAGGNISRDIGTGTVGDYVIVCCNTDKDPLKRPFWVAHIVDNDHHQSRLKVSWLLPPTTQKSRLQTYPVGNTVGGRSEEPTDLTKVEAPVVRESYISPSAPPKHRANKPQKPFTACVIKNYPYAAFRQVLDANTNKQSHSNKGQRAVTQKPVWIHYNTCFFTFQHLTKDGKLPSGVLDQISEHPQIDWMG